MKLIHKFRRVFEIIIARVIMHGYTGTGCHFNGIPTIYGNKKALKLGNNVAINSGKRYNPIGGDTRMLFRTSDDGKITIGNNVGISNSTIVSKKSVTIEDNVMIGGSCKIYDTDFHSLNYDERILTNDPGVVSKPILIKQGAFIGAHSIILKGVTIGKKSIIGAGSVVTKDIPDGEIWAGDPAKFIKNSNL